MKLKMKNESFMNETFLKKSLYLEMKVSDIMFNKILGQKPNIKH